MIDSLYIAKHLDLLGRPVVDKVTKFTGVVTAVSFDLYGCVQAVVSPSGLDKDGKLRESVWFDVNRLVLAGNGEQVMNPPDWLGNNAQARGEQGAAEKPTRHA